ncbi:MAG: hypothetical protein LBU51_03485, partial [Bacteroidales bacterium]|nr:hypothetical protein [Bacteroidales bacterium]
MGGVVMDSIIKYSAQSGSNANDLVAATKKQFVEMQECLRKTIQAYNACENLVKQIYSLNDQLVRENGSFQATIKDINAKSTNLQMQITDINTRNVQLQQTVNTKQQEYQNLKIQNDEQTNKHTQLVNAYKTLQSENERNKKMIQEISDKQKIRESEIRDYLSQIEFLEKQISPKETTIKS